MLYFTHRHFNPFFINWTGEVFNAIDGLVGVDPYSSAMAVTLDLICLSQPSEPQEDEEWRSPKDFLVKRKTSSDSFFGNPNVLVLDPDVDQEQRQRLVSQVSRDDRLVRSRNQGFCLCILSLNYLIVFIKNNNMMAKTITPITPFVNYYPILQFICVIKALSFSLTFLSFYKICLISLSKTLQKLNPLLKG